MGYGKALTGFFRSRMALSFYLAAALAWIQPQWLGRNPGLLALPRNSGSQHPDPLFHSPWHDAGTRAGCSAAYIPVSS